MTVSRILGVLGTLERVTRPQMGHDYDEPLTEAEPVDPSIAYLYEDEPPAVIKGARATLDDVVAQLAQIAYLTEDVRNILTTHFAGAAASLADGKIHSPSGGVSSLDNPSVREDKQQNAPDPALAGGFSPADPQQTPPASHTAGEPGRGRGDANSPNPSASTTPAGSPNDGLRALCDLAGLPYSVIANVLRDIADDLDPPKSNK